MTNDFPCRLSLSFFFLQLHLSYYFNASVTKFTARINEVWSHYLRTNETSPQRLSHSAYGGYPQTNPPPLSTSATSPPAPNARASLLIIMGYGCRVRSGQSPAGDELQIKQKVQKSGCFFPLAIWTLARNLSPCACFNVPLLIQKKGWHTKDLALAKGKKILGRKRWREQKSATVCLLSLSSVLLFLSLPCWVLVSS